MIDTFNRVTGLLVIEVLNSNPNGDPDRESDPRLRLNDYGEISPVSFKRKLRDLVDAKEGPVWEAVRKLFDPPLNDQEFCILETRGRDRPKMLKEFEAGTATKKYWDGRVFGNTFIEEKASNYVRTGVAQFGLGVSLAPVHVERLTTTNPAVEENKTVGMAPLGYRVVVHGVYTMPFFVNPTVAHKSGCQRTDIDVMFKVIPYAYSHTASYIRSSVEIRHAWVIEHKSPLGSVSDFALLDALRPRKKCNPEAPSQSWEDYEVPNGLPEDVAGRVLKTRDLMAEAYAAAAGT